MNFINTQTLRRTVLPTALMVLGSASAFQVVRTQGASRFASTTLPATPTTLSTATSAVAKPSTGWVSSNEEPKHNAFYASAERSARLSQSLIQMKSYQAKPYSVPSPVIDIFARAFAGSPTSPAEPVMSWGLHPFLPKGKDKFQEEWHKTFRFLLEGFTSEGGIFLGVPNGNGSYEAGVMIKEYDPRVEFSSSTMKDMKDGIMMLGGFVEGALTGTLPKVFLNPSKASTFMEVFGRLTKESKELHKQYGPSGKHIYVAAVGVDPAFQGKGLGKRIMQQVSDISDATGMPAYLECSGEKNRAVYEKSGYIVVGEKVFTMEEYGGPYNMKLFFMIRQPEPVEVDDRVCETCSKGE